MNCRLKNSRPPRWETLILTTPVRVTRFTLSVNLITSSFSFVMFFIKKDMICDYCNLICFRGLWWKKDGRSVEKNSAWSTSSSSCIRLREESHVCARFVTFILAVIYPSGNNSHGCIVGCSTPDKYLSIDSVDVVLVEGILTFYFSEIRELFDLKLFVDTDADTRLSRRGSYTLLQLT